MPNLLSFDFFKMIGNTTKFIVTTPVKRKI